MVASLLVRSVRAWRLDGRQGGRAIRSDCSLVSLVSIGDPTAGEVVRSEFHLDLVAWEDSDVVHPHLPGDVREHLVSVVEFDLEHGSRQRLEDLALEYDRIFLWLGQGILLT